MNRVLINRFLIALLFAFVAGSSFCFLRGMQFNPFAAAQKQVRNEGLSEREQIEEDIKILETLKNSVSKLKGGIANRSQKSIVSDKKLYTLDWTTLEPGETVADTVQIIQNKITELEGQLQKASAQEEVVKQVSSAAQAADPGFSNEVKQEVLNKISQSSSSPKVNVDLSKMDSNKDRLASSTKDRPSFLGRRKPTRKPRKGFSGAGEDQGVVAQADPVENIIALAPEEEPSVIKLSEEPLKELVKLTPEEQRAQWRTVAQEEAAAQAELHVPLCMFIDEGSETESPKEERVYAVTRSVSQAFIQKAAPIILSHGLLYNIIHRKNNNMNKDILSNTSLLKSEWDLFFVAETQFFLALPKKFKKYIEYFNYQQFEDLTHLLPADNEPGLYSQLLSKIMTYKNLPRVTKTNFERIFNWKKFKDNDISKDSSPIWDIFINGHGERFKENKYIAAMTIETFKDFLDFLNTNMTIGVLMVSSCYSGGVNLQELFATQDFKFSNDLHFPFIVASVGDTPTTGLPDLKVLMNEAKQIKSFGENALGKLMRTLHTSPMGDLLDPHGSSTIPQIILPGGIKIQTLYPENDVSVIGNVMAKRHEFEKKPIITYEKTFKDKTGRFKTQEKNAVKNILIYPTRINVPLYIKPVPEQDQSVQAIDFALQTLPSNMQLRKSNISVVSDLFPAILSMVQGESTHQFKNVVLSDKNGKYGLGNILDFIRHSFLGYQADNLMKIFVIDELTGKNDIGLTLAAVRRVQENAIPHPLEEKLKNQSSITLKKVIIKKRIEAVPNQVGERAFQAKGGCSIQFMLNDGSAWRLAHNFSKPPTVPWDFKQISVDEHLKQFEEANQKIPSYEKESIGRGQKTKEEISVEQIAQMNAEKEAAQKAEVARIAQLKAEQEAAQRAEEARRIAEENKKAEDARLADEARRAEEARRIEEESQKAEAARIAQLKTEEEAARLAQLKAEEEAARLADEARRAQLRAEEADRLAVEKAAQKAKIDKDFAATFQGAGLYQGDVAGKVFGELQNKMEAFKQQKEAGRLAKKQRKAEQEAARLAQLKAEEEAARLAEEARRAEEARLAAENKKAEAAAKVKRLKEKLNLSGTIIEKKKQLEEVAAQREEARLAAENKKAEAAAQAERQEKIKALKKKLNVSGSIHEKMQSLEMKNKLAQEDQKAEAARIAQLNAEKEAAQQAEEAQRLADEEAAAKAKINKEFKATFSGKGLHQEGAAGKVFDELKEKMQTFKQSNINNDLERCVKKLKKEESALAQLHESKKVLMQQHEDTQQKIQELESRINNLRNKIKLSSKQLKRASSARVAA